ncbi:MAG: cytochrome c biogenesis protein [Candidatus Methanogasteraceae archaeon]
MNRKTVIGIVLPLLVIFFLITPSAQAYSTDDCKIEFFYEIGCKKCDKARPVVDTFAEENNLSVTDYEISNPVGIKKTSEYGIYVVPAVAVCGQVICYSDYGGDLATLTDLLNQSMQNIPIMQNQTQIGGSTNQTSYTNQTDQTDQTDPTNQTGMHQPLIKLSVPAVFVAGLIAGFNPCLLAILAFIASITLSSGESGKNGSRRMFWLVLVFCAGIFITYLVAGFGLLQAIGHTEGTRETIENILIIIIVLLGIWHIYDAYHVMKYDRSSFRASGSTMRFIENMIKKESLPAIFVLGVLFSLVKAPCVGALYLSILKMLLGEGTASGALYLGVYNIGVVFPVLVLGLAITFGMQPESVSRYKDEHRSAIRFVTGALLLAIAVLMGLGVV